MKAKHAGDGRKIYADLSNGPETQLLLAILWQAVMDADGDIAARRWLTDPHPACKAYCRLLGLSPQHLRERVEEKYGEQTRAA